MVLCRTVSRGFIPPEQLTSLITCVTGFVAAGPSGVRRLQPPPVSSMSLALVHVLSEAFL